jgi:serine/threonine protein kinase
MQNLNHPNVVKLYHVESDSDFRWILMQVMAQ